MTEIKIGDAVWYPSVINSSGDEGVFLGMVAEKFGPDEARQLRMFNGAVALESACIIAMPIATLRIK